MTSRPNWTRRLFDGRAAYHQSLLRHRWEQYELRNAAMLLWGKHYADPQDEIAAGLR